MTRPRRAIQNRGDITLLLSDVNNPDALRTVLGLAYPELRDVAVRYMRNERPGRTLQPTALLHEGCLRLLQTGAVLKNRRHFFGAASKAMRRVLIDSARRRLAGKRGGHWRRDDFGEAERIGFLESGELLGFDSALTRLAAIHPLWSEVVELHVFGHRSTAEIATILGIGASTARKRWTSAKRWLQAELTSDQARPAAPEQKKKGPR